MKLVFAITVAFYFLITISHVYYNRNLLQADLAAKSIRRFLRNLDTGALMCQPRVRCSHRVFMIFTPVLAGPRHTFRAAAPGLSPKVIDAANVLTLIPAFVTGIQVSATSTTSTLIHHL